jgi:organic radical activating enzyme
MRLEYQDERKKDWFLVAWDLSGKCNYRCSYCPSFLHDGKNGWPDYNDTIAFVDKLASQLPNKQICYRFSGGEPTYWKHFTDLIKHIKSKGHYVSFLTNGSRDIEYFKQINEYVDGMIMSYHPEYSKTNHFIDISNTMTCPIAVNLMLLPESFDSTMAIADELYSNSKLAIWPKVIMDKTSEIITNEIVSYTDEQSAIIKDWKYFRKLDDSKIHRGQLLLDGSVVSANDLIMNGLNKHKGWTCYSGVDQINVSIEGLVYKADCQVGGSIGSIQNFTLPTEPQTCDKDYCTCLSDIYIRKHD